MTILSARKELPMQQQTDELLEDTPIFDQLLGRAKIEYKVEPRMFANRRRRGKTEKRGTNFSNTPKKDGESADGAKDDKNKLRKRKKKKEGAKKVKFKAGADNVAFVEGETDDKKDKKKKRRKKREVDGEEKDKQRLTITGTIFFGDFLR